MDEQEVELRDYINMLVRRKKLIIGITLVAILISGILSYFVLPPIYKGSAIVLPPQIGGNFSTGFIYSDVQSTSFLAIQLIKPEEIQSMIKDSSFLAKIQNKTGISYSDLAKDVSVSVPPDTNFVKAEFESTKKGNIQDFFNTLIDLLNETSSLSYEKNFSFLKTKVTDYENQVKILNEEEKRILDEIESLNKSGDKNYEIGLLVLENIYNSIVNNKVSVESELKNLKYQIDNTHPFVYLSSPSIPDVPVKPNKLLNVAITGVAALFFSILLAFFLEYWYRTKSESK
jgi:capsular polysaccharide biosynthesis protein